MLIKMQLQEATVKNGINKILKYDHTYCYHTIAMQNTFTRETRFSCDMASPTKNSINLVNSWNSTTRNDYTYTSLTHYITPKPLNISCLALLRPLECMCSTAFLTDTTRVHFDPPYMRINMQLAFRKKETHRTLFTNVQTPDDDMTVDYYAMGLLSLSIQGSVFCVNVIYWITQHPRSILYLVCVAAFLCSILWPK